MTAPAPTTGPTAPPAGEQTPPANDQGAGAPAAPPATEPDPPGAEHLGDPGKRALDAMKAERKAAQEEARRIREDFEKFKAEVAGKQAEYEQQQREKAVQDEAIAKANQRILKAEVRALATGRLADPQDALRFLDLSEFEVGSDGEVDGDAVTAAIEDLVKTKPYLAAQGGKRFQGDGDGGARNGSQGRSFEEQIAEAEKNGDHLRAIRLKQDRAAALREKK